MDSDKKPVKSDTRPAKEKNMTLNSSRKLSFAFACLLLGGCASATFSRVGEHTATALPENCKVTVLVSKPSKSYKEIGVINFSGSFFTGAMDGPASPEEALKMSRSEICKNGGNGLILWEANGAGRFKKGTVVRID